MRMVIDMDREPVGCSSLERCEVRVSAVIFKVAWLASTVGERRGVAPGLKRELRWPGYRRGETRKGRRHHLQSMSQRSWLRRSEARGRGVKGPTVPPCHAPKLPDASPIETEAART